jgi:hypothetical protein
MGNLLERGAAWLALQLQKHAATPIVYMRGNEQVELQATIGRTEFEVEDVSGFLQQFQSRDYLFPAAALMLGGSVTLPKIGDRIAERQGGHTYLYEVLAPGRAPHFRFSDEFRTLLRVHTKHVSTEELPT